MKFAIVVMLMIFETVTVFAESKPSESKSIALTIILDTSGSTEHMADFRTLSRQAITSLKPGDYFEIISAQSEKPKIRAAQSIKTGTPEEIKNVNSILKGIRSGFLSNARIDRALEMTFKRLEKTCS